MYHRHINLSMWQATRRASRVYINMTSINKKKGICVCVFTSGAFNNILSQLLGVWRDIAYPRVYNNNIKERERGSIFISVLARGLKNHPRGARTLRGGQKKNLFTERRARHITAGSYAINTYMYIFSLYTVARALLFHHHHPCDGADIERIEIEIVCGTTHITLFIFASMKLSHYMDMQTRIARGFNYQSLFLFFFI